MKNNLCKSLLGGHISCWGELQQKKNLWQEKFLAVVDI